MAQVAVGRMDASMGQDGENLVRRMQEALRGAGLSEVERLHVVECLHARVRRLRSLSASYREVALSRHVEGCLPSARSA